jgi:hypothetical protein
VTLDAPVYNHLNRSLSQSYLTKASWTHVTSSGVEDLRVDIVTAGGTDENHAWNGVLVSGAQDSWVRNITALHFGFAGVSVTNGVRITVADSAANNPVGVRTGGRFYNFAAGHKGQLVLFTKCSVAPDARHGLVCSGGPDTSGVVFHRCNVTGGHDMEGGHMKWTSGVLFDNIVENGAGSLRLINRGDWGTQHGWGSVHSVAWAFNKGMLIQKPPTAQNYGISATGTFPTNWPKPGPQGFVEQKAGALVPTSLYEAQLCDRLENGGATPTPSPTPGPRATPTPTPTPAPSGGVVLFGSCSYGGWSASFPPGSYRISDIVARGGANDATSSLRVPSGFTVTLYANDNFSGASHVVTGDDSCLTGDGFNDVASSLRVVQN